jgi:two-component system, OmpR family, sensor histidine kinase KdpD
LMPIASSQSRFELEPSEVAVANWVGEHRQPAGSGTDTLPGASALYLPLLGAEAQVGVLGFKPGERSLDLSATRLLETFANSLGMALERALLAKESNDARIAAESERIRSTLLSSISHDLRTPLTSITGAASSLRDGNPNQSALIDTIHDESVRLNHQIQNLLDMTRLQSGGVELNLEWHSPQDLVATALDHARISLGEREIVIQNPETVPLLKVDGLLVEKALVNLFENAGRYTPAGAKLAIVIEVQGAQLLLRVRDNGPGIADEDLAKLFTPGYRTPSGGYGLGLAVVKAVIDLHGGNVKVENLPNGGAGFTLAFPLPADQPEAPHE